MANEPLDLEQVIEDSVNDSLNTDAGPVEAETDTTADAPDTTEEDALRGHEASPDQVSTPAAGTDEESKEEPSAEDEFAKKFGIQANSVTGRENRIPYSRVKKIVEKNEKDTIARVTKELETKFAKFPEFETKIKDYEGRLEKVAQFEQILDSDPRTFLNMLSQHPSYTDFFKAVEQAFATQQAAPQQQQQADPAAGMPQPDQTLSDGSKVYSMEGLQALLKWQSDQVEQRTIKQVEQRYKPIEQAWQSQEQLAKIVPVVQRQIAEARTWDKFEELEPRVVELLQADSNISLERAYVKAYQESQIVEREKLSTDRNKIRQEVIADMKKKPSASSSPTGAVKPGTQESVGPRNMEDVITEELRKAGLMQ